jgi:Ca-activated chloride channel family protein
VRSAPRRRSRPIIVVVLCVLALALAGTLVVEQGGFAALLGGCRDDLQLEVVTGADTAPLLRQLAGAYGKDKHKVGNRCVAPNVTVQDPATVVGALARGTQSDPPPDVWLPASSAWANLLESARPGLVPTEWPKVATSPLVLAMPRPMAQALGWPARQPGWSDLLRALQNPAGWGAFGHPAWGPILFGKTNPTVSTAGLHAGIATFAVLSGSPQAVSLRTVTDKRVAGTVLGVERAPGPYAETTEAFLAGLQQADDQGAALHYVSALPVEEKAVLDYNQGNPSGQPETLGKHPRPKVPLVAVYPKEGTLESDHPYVTLQAPWVSDAKRQAAADFLDYLHSGPVQARFAAAGFRTFQGTAGPAATTDNGLVPSQPRAVMPFPNPKVTGIIAGSWEKVRRRGNVLSLIDVSGSMKAKVPGTNVTKLDLVKRAALSSLSLFSDEDDVGLWTFSIPVKNGIPVPGAPEWRIAVPVGRMGDLIGGRPRRAIHAAALKAMVADGGTPLYDTTLAAVRYVQRNWIPSRINTVVLLTDGKNEKQGGLSLRGLLAALKDTGGRPVRVITIAYGADADQAVLRQIAATTQGAAYVSADPRAIQQIFVNAISNF